MSGIQVQTKTQTLQVSPTTKSVSLILAGPQGPPGQNGLSGDVDASLFFDEIDTKIAAHEQAAVVHINATSGRNFVALFENGLI